jgi:hypothetical protein
LLRALEAREVTYLLKKTMEGLVTDSGGPERFSVDCVDCVDCVD